MIDTNGGVFLDSDHIVNANYGAENTQPSLFSAAASDLAAARAGVLSNAANPAIDKTAILKDLNPEQRKAVMHEQGPLLVLSGAGSGKTRVITRRICYLMQVCGVPAYNIMAITFTNKAAFELKNRVDKLLGTAVRGAWIGTFHAMMLRVLRRFGAALGYRDNFTIFDVADSERVMKDVLANLGGKEALISPKEALQTVSSLKNKGITPELLTESDVAFYAGDLHRIYAAYQKSLFNLNALDFDDILLKTLQLFQEHKDIAELYQNRFQHIMVDEYQDTNAVQYELVRLLARKHRNLCVVGDDDQSIYAFRGANVQNILNFEKDFANCTVIRLEQNYRSTEVILDAANAIICKNQARKEKKLWTNQKGGARILFYNADDHFDEARFVARDIERRIKLGVKPAEIAILYRVNALSRNLEYALRERGINYKIFGGTRFYDRKEIKDVTAYLRLIVSNEDDVAFLRAVATPKRGIGEQSLARIAEIAAQTRSSMLEVCRRSPNIPELQRVSLRLKSFAELIDSLSLELVNNKHENISDFISEVEHRSGLIAALEAAKTTDGSAASRIENLKELLSDALEFEANLLQNLDDYAADLELTDADSQKLISSAEDDRKLSLELFLERTVLLSEQDMVNESNFISLMTVHSAKGLEFDTVYIVGAEEGIFPSFRAFTEINGLEEERRLAYVAITRARRHLIITRAGTRLLFGQTQYNPPSQIFSDIPAELLDLRGLAANAVTGQDSAASEFRWNYGGADGGFNAQNRTGKSFRDLGDKRSDTGLTDIALTDKRNDSHSARGFDFTAAIKSSVSDIKKAVNKNGAQSLDYRTLQKGDLLRHVSLGEGRLVKITPVGKDAILSIDFGGVEKRFLANSGSVQKI